MTGNLREDWQRYVDLDDAMKRLGGNKAIYKKLLGKFLANGDIDALYRQLDEGDLETAAKTAHTIKGVTGNLSLKEAYAGTVGLETGLKAGKCDRELADALRIVYRDTLECCKQLMETL